MRLKALLLGSATALAVAGGAQAADLSVAEPVDYVRVCDAFGTGYWYVPGTDVCIKIWGLVRWEVDFYPGEDNFFSEYNNYPNEGNHWAFDTNLLFSVSAKSMTDWGPLEAYLDTWDWGWNEAWVSLGPLLAGYTQSLFNSWGPYALDDIPYGNWYQSEHRADQIRLTWAMNGFGLAIGLEEPNYNNYPGVVPAGYAYFYPGYPGNGPYYYGYDSYSSMPDIVAALTFSNASFDGKVSFVYSDYLTRVYDGYNDGRPAAWAVAAGVVIKLDSIAPGDALLLKAAYGTALPYIIGGGFAFNWNNDIWPGQIAWSAMASFKHYFSPNFYASITGNYAQATSWWDGPGGTSSWQAEFDLSYSPAPTLWITPGVRWTSVSEVDGTNFSSWMATIRIQKTLF
jgi:hypothetical protein